MPLSGSTAKPKRSRQFTPSTWAECSLGLKSILFRTMPSVMRSFIQESRTLFLFLRLCDSVEDHDNILNMLVASRTIFVFHRGIATHVLQNLPSSLQPVITTFSLLEPIEQQGCVKQPHSTSPLIAMERTFWR